MTGLREAERGVAIFDQDEKYDAQFSMRAPSALVKRVEAVAKEEGLRSVNEARVQALRMGLSVYELLAEHPDTLKDVRAEGRLTVEEAAVRLLSEAIAARKKRPKK